MIGDEHLVKFKGRVKASKDRVKIRTKTKTRTRATTRTRVRAGEEVDRVVVEVAEVVVVRGSTREMGGVTPITTEVEEVGVEVELVRLIWATERISPTRQSPSRKDSSARERFWMDDTLHICITPSILFIIVYSGIFLFVCFRRSMRK
jgi:hypothetical protein